MSKIVIISRDGVVLPDSATRLNQISYSRIGHKDKMSNDNKDIGMGVMKSIELLMESENYTTSNCILDINSDVTVSISKRLIVVHSGDYDLLQRSLRDFPVVFERSVSEMINKNNIQIMSIL